MTLRARLIVSNLAMVLIPVLLLILLNGVLLSFLQEGGNSPFHDLTQILRGRPKSFRETAVKSQELQREVNVLLLTNPQVLEDSQMWQQLAQDLENNFGGIIVRKDETVLYASPIFRDPRLFQSLPQFGDIPKNLYTLPKEFQKKNRLIGHWDFLLKGAGKGSLFIFWRNQQWERELDGFTTVLAIGFFLFTFGANGLLTWLFSRRLSRPLGQLRSAAKKIEVGDFSSLIEYGKRDELTPLFEAFERMRMKLQENQGLRDRYETNRREMIANIAHDLRTPITAINGYVQGILDGVAATPEKQIQYFNVIASKAKDLAHLADELFFFSNLDMKAVPYNFQKLDFAAFVTDLWEEITLDYATRGLRGHTPKIPEKRFWIRADAPKLRKVVVNLAENAVKFKRGEEVTWSWEAVIRDGFVEWRFTDTGRGISPDALPHIFERFYREDDARTPSVPGTGLGLAIVKHIVHDHGGTITAESLVGQGTTFTLSLPKIEEGRPS